MVLTATTEHLRLEMLKEALALVGVGTAFTTLGELVAQSPHVIARRALAEPDTVEAFLRLRPRLCSVYSTTKMTALHANCSTKHRQPAVCMLRQLLKANDLQLAPHTRSAGYDAVTRRKVVEREYYITPRR